MAIKIRRGTDTARLAVIFEEGEVVYTTDTKSFFIGDGVTAGGNQIGGTTAASLLKAEVHNATGVTLTKGQVVYLNGNTGNKPNAVLAQANSEATSSKTIGLIILNISNNANGDIATDGLLSDLNTSAFVAGDLLWLSDTIAGGVTTIIPDTPNHAVFIGYVVRAHATQGSILIHIQNGYELNEIHDVKITSVANGDVLSYDSTLGYWKNIANSSFSPPNGLLKIASAISTTFQVVKDYVDNASVLFLNSRRIGIGKDTSVTTQSVAVVEVQDTNTSIVLKPNGTGAIIASVPDGTTTGGNARGQYAVDLQTFRYQNLDVASGQSSGILTGQGNRVSGDVSGIISGYLNRITTNYSIIGGGQQNNISGTNAFIGSGVSNTVSSNFSTVSGGQSNTASTNTHATVVGGQSNTASGQGSTVANRNNTASGQYTFVSGFSNTASNGFSGILGGSGNILSGSSSGMVAATDSACAGSSNSLLGGNLNQIGNGTSNSLSGGRSNSINNGVDYSFLGGGQSNVISGASGGADWGVVCGGQSNLIENTHTSILGGNNNNAFGLYSSVLGTKDGFSYLYGSTVSSGGLFSTRGDAQQSNLTARREAVLTTGGTTVLSLDGTGTTNLIIPNGNNRAWNVTIDTIAVVTAITGTATGVTVGDCYRETKQLLFKRIGGTSSIVGTVDTSAIKSDSGMATALLTITAGASQQMAITFTAPTFAGGGSVTCRVVSKVSLVEVAY